MHLCTQRSTLMNWLKQLLQAPFVANADYFERLKRSISESAPPRMR